MNIIVLLICVHKKGDFEVSPTRIYFSSNIFLNMRLTQHFLLWLTNRRRKRQ